MTNLPVEQVGESQRLAAQLHIEPEAKVMQSDFRRQARLKAVQRVRAWTPQPEGIEQLVIDGLNESRAAQPTSVARAWTSALYCVGAEVVSPPHHSARASGDASDRLQSLCQLHRRPVQERRHWSDAARDAAEQQRRFRPENGHCNWPRRSQSR